MKKNSFEIYGTNVFSESVMRERLPKDIYSAIKKSMDYGEPLEPVIADVVASAIKDWAVEKGATHYCHWFQPMTEATAEKHDAFITPDKDGRAVIEFSGKQLIKGESDASSFPSGGLRATFEARGYTAWDVSSPVFVKTNGDIKSLFIPCAFCSQNGEVLDKKTPLLRSMDALNKEALRVLKAIGDTETKRVVPTLGAEQEYFLVPLELAEKRLDLKVCGRTLFGEFSAKGQELEDHYFGSIKESVANFMNEVNIELWQLGVSAKTQHNEVAPAQFELAPSFDSVNVATDQNQLIMDTLRKVAERHGFMCLLHEKPFAGLNGSGKHNNYSLITDNGLNLFNPGVNPAENTKFLLFMSAMVRAVDKYQGLLRSTAATAGNDHRLGGNEAPPGIISVFLGTDIARIFESYATSQIASNTIGKTFDLGTAIHNLSSDATDRNRTSPMAFTGNKFEFRMVGSAQSTSGPNFALNTMIADILSEFADIIESSKDKEQAVKDIVKMTAIENKRIIFNGDNYSEDWVKEAENRGLLNIKSTPEALKELVSEDAKALFVKHNVLTEAELMARYEILLERYSKAVILEAVIMSKMITREIIPSVLSYSGSLANDVLAIKSVGLTPPKTLTSMLSEVISLVDSLKNKSNELENLIIEIKKIDAHPQKAIALKQQVRPIMHDLRVISDMVESMIDKKYWPIPSYTDLLFKYL